MRHLIIGNMLYNMLFVAMALSEMTGMTAVHNALPWWLKWWWIVALAGGNLAIHVAMLRSMR